MKRSVFCLLVAAGLSIVGLSSCAQTQIEEGDIVLRSYDDSNYAALNAALGTRACIVGTLEVDSLAGVRFLLQPYERNGVVTPSPSRVVIDFGEETVAQHRLRDGQRRRVCGILQDATPWRTCRDDGCKWYELRDPQLD